MADGRDSQRAGPGRAEQPTKTLDLEWLAALPPTPLGLGRLDDLIQADRLQSSPVSLEALADLAPLLLTPATDRRDFAVRLAEEVSRAERGISLFSLLLLELEGGELQRRAGLASMAVGDTLRDYDICRRVADDLLAVIMPGTTDVGCGRAINRLRAVLDQREVGDLAMGGGSWSPGDRGLEPLVERATSAVARDRAGLGGADASRVPDEPQTRVVLWAEGVGHAQAADALPADGGLTIRMRLPVPRPGSAVHLTGRSGRRWSGTVKEAELDRTEQPIVTLRVG